MPMAKLDTILEQHVCPDIPIDIISIDIDGSETLALQAFDILRWSPRVIIFEISTVPNVIYSFMKEKGYILSRQIGCNVIYTQRADDAQKIQNAKINLPRYEIKHPCGW